MSISDMFGDYIQQLSKGVYQALILLNQSVSEGKKPIENPEFKKLPIETRIKAMRVYEELNTI